MTQRLASKAREVSTLPAGYQFGDAGRPVVASLVPRVMPVSGGVLVTGFWYYETRAALEADQMARIGEVGAWLQRHAIGPRRLPVIPHGGIDAGDCWRVGPYRLIWWFRAIQRDFGLRIDTIVDGVQPATRPRRRS